MTRWVMLSHVTPSHEEAEQGWEDELLSQEESELEGSEEEALKANKATKSSSGLESDTKKMSVSVRRENLCANIFLAGSLELRIGNFTFGKAVVEGH